MLANTNRVIKSSNNMLKKLIDEGGRRSRHTDPCSRLPNARRDIKRAPAPLWHAPLNEKRMPAHLLIFHKVCRMDTHDDHSAQGACQHVRTT